MYRCAFGWRRMEGESSSMKKIWGWQQYARNRLVLLLTVSGVVAHMRWIHQQHSDLVVGFHVVGERRLGCIVNDRPRCKITL